MEEATVITKDGGMSAAWTIGILVSLIGVLATIIGIISMNYLKQMVADNKENRNMLVEQGFILTAQGERLKAQGERLNSLEKNIDEINASPLMESSHHLLEEILGKLRFMTPHPRKKQKAPKQQ